MKKSDIIIIIIIIIILIFTNPRLVLASGLAHNKRFGDQNLKKEFLNFPRRASCRFHSICIHLTILKVLSPLLVSFLSCIKDEELCSAV